MPTSDIAVITVITVIKTTRQYTNTSLAEQQNQGLFRTKDSHIPKTHTEDTNHITPKKAKTTLHNVAKKSPLGICITLCIQIYLYKNIDMCYFGGRGHIYNAGCVIWWGHFFNFDKFWHIDKIYSVKYFF